MIKHIFLTGEIQTGKSTLIDRVLAMHPLWQVGGFKTVTASAKAGESRRAVYLLPAGKSDAPCTACNLVGIRLGAGQRTAKPEVFDREGVVLLAHSEEADLIVMDELGTMENEALLFQEKVQAVLNGKKSVLGVLKKKETPFLISVRNRPDVRVITLTLEGFDEALKQVDDFLREALKT